MDLATLFATTSLTFGLPPGLLDSVCYKESRHNPVAYRAQDGDGTPSYGLCQVKEKTCRWLKVKGDLMHPETNVQCAGKYLAYQLKRYKGDYVKSIVAYNKGNAKTNKGNRYSRDVLKYHKRFLRNQEWAANP